MEVDVLKNYFLGK